MSKFRVISQSPITLNLLSGKTISAVKGMVVEPVQDHLFKTALKNRCLVRHKHVPQAAAPVPVPAAAVAPAPVVAPPAPVEEVKAEEAPISAEERMAVEESAAWEAEAAAEEAEVVEAVEPDAQPEVGVDAIGLAARTVSALVAGGFTTANQLAAASDEELVAVSGIGETTVLKIREQLAAHGF